MIIEPVGYVPGDFCGPTALAAITHAPRDVVMEACRDAIFMTEASRRPEIVKGMTLKQLLISVELLTDTDQTRNSWCHFDDDVYPGRKPTIVREWLATGRSKLMQSRKLLVCGGYRNNLHVAAVYGDQAVDTFSRGRIVPIEQLTMRRCLMDSYIGFPTDLTVSEEALEKYGRSDYSACPDARRRAARSFR